MNDCNPYSEDQDLDANRDPSPDKSQKPNIWIEKLKPSTKNKIIQNKFTEILSVKEYTSKIITENIETDHEIYTTQKDKNSGEEIYTSNGEIETYSDKWSKYLLQSNIDNSELNISTPTENNTTLEVDNSAWFFEEIENLIEENYKSSYDEHMFLKKTELHTIIPFLLLNSKEIHRMCLSDYEIKFLYKNLIEKIKTYEMDPFDYYRIGFINFYKGKYLLAFKNFRNGIKAKDKDPHIVKWYCFVSIILLICEPNKINFSNLKKDVVTEVQESGDVEEEGGAFSFLPCCAGRKKKNERNKVTNLFDNDKSSSSHNSNLDELRKMDVKLEELGNEIISLLKYLTDKNSKNITSQIQLESWWMLMILSTYVKINKSQKLFDESFLYDPLYCIKKLKEHSDYLSYIAYAEYNHIISDEYQIDVILNQLISKYPDKIEAYLRYWQLLTKGKYKNYSKANSLSEMFWKNCATLQFDDGIYGLYVFFTRTKSLFLIGNFLFSISYLQKEFPCNFLFSSIYYMFGKYTSKSNSKPLKYIAISVLKESSRLVFNDLQYSALYWLGNIYYNVGNYYLTYKYWKKFSENADKSFDCSVRKLDRIKVFIKKYELLWKSLTQLKSNLKQIKSKNKDIQLSTLTSTVSGTSMNREKYSSLASNEISKFNNIELINYLQIIQTIKEIEFNLKSNRTITYEYYVACSYFYIEKNIPLALRILVNIINCKKYFMNAIFLIWKILCYTNDFKLLLYFSYFALKISHYNEVPFSNWIKCYILYSKALKKTQQYDDAILVLINCLDLYAHIPLESLKYLDKIYSQNKISTTNYFADFDKALQFYSKYQVYKKNQTIFDKNKIYKVETQPIIVQEEIAEQPKFQNNFDDVTEITKFENFNPDIDTFNDSFNNSIFELSPENFLAETDNIIPSPISKPITIEMSLQSSTYKPSHVPLADLGIDSLEKLAEYIDNKIDKIEIPKESPFVTIISDPEIFYQIGKLCAKSSTKRELGLMCLEDYITLTNYFSNYKPTTKCEKKKQRAFFWMTVLNIQLKQYNQAKQCIDHIPNLYLLENMKKDSKHVKDFVEFYKQFGNPEDTLNESSNFIISKVDLYET